MADTVTAPLFTASWGATKVARTGKCKDKEQATTCTDGPGHRAGPSEKGHRREEGRGPVASLDAPSVTNGATETQMEFLNFEMKK